MSNEEEPAEECGISVGRKDTGQEMRRSSRREKDSFHTVWGKKIHIMR
jgi:hypothetical protein